MSLRILDELYFRKISSEFLYFLLKELERKAAELERREAELKNIQTQGGKLFSLYVIFYDIYFDAFRLSIKSSSMKMAENQTRNLGIVRSNPTLNKILNFILGHFC